MEERRYKHPQWKEELITREERCDRHPENSVGEEKAETFTWFIVKNGGSQGTNTYVFMSSVCSVKSLLRLFCQKESSFT